VNTDLGMAIVALRSGRLRESRELFRELFREAHQQGDPIEAAHAALGLGGMWVHEHRAFDEREGFLATLQIARTGVANLDPLLVARLDVRLGAELVYVGKGTTQQVYDAVERIGEFGDAHAEAEALSLLFHLLLAPERTEERSIAAERMIAAAARANDPYFSTLAMMWHTVGLFMSGSPFAHRELESLRLRCAAIQNVAISFIVATLDVTLALRCGDIKRTEELASTAFSLGVECGDVDAEAFFGGQLLCARWIQGTSTELLSAGRRLQTSPDVHFANPLFSAAVAVMAAEAGELDEARRAVAHASSILKFPAVAGVSSVRLSSFFALGEAAAVLEDRTAAAFVLEQLLPFADLPITGSLGVSCFGSTWRSIAVAQRTLGDEDDAIKSLRNAKADNERFGHQPMIAICYAELGELLLKSSDESERDEAIVCLAEAIRIGTTCQLSGRVPGWRMLLDREVLVRSLRDDLPKSDNAGSLHRASDNWTIVCALGSAVVPARRGMEHLSMLLLNPLVEVSVAQLIGSPVALSQPIFDDDAKIALGKHVRRLQGELEEAKMTANISAAEKIETELERMVELVEQSSGLFGRSRNFNDEAERGRTAVQKSLRRAISEIEKQSPALGQEISRSIRTGFNCSFVPTDHMPVHWVLRT
jgi:tetratricopeptide (TPR) repeat protein